MHVFGVGSAESLACVDAMLKGGQVGFVVSREWPRALGVREYDVAIVCLGRIVDLEHARLFTEIAEAPVVWRLAPSVLRTDVLCAATGSGVSRIVVAGDDSAHVWKRLLKELTPDIAIAAAMARLSAFLPAHAMRLLQRLVDSRTQLSVDAAKRTLRMSTRELAEALGCSDCLPPAVTLRWCRMLISAELLDRTSGTPTYDHAWMGSAEAHLKQLRRHLNGPLRRGGLADSVERAMSGHFTLFNDAAVEAVNAVGSETEQALDLVCLAPRIPGVVS